MHAESLGAILRIERYKRNLTQEQVCKELKMKISTLSRIENNKSVRGTSIKKLINYYQMNKKEQG
jgi:transcriptional regulator with XRE-family HTH domain